MKDVKVLLSYLLKFIMILFVAIGVLAEYIFQETGRVSKEATKPSRMRYKWWWEK